jgi:2-iminobutanoate/2-iminopropanoate deaminase
MPVLGLTVETKTFELAEEVELATNGIQAVKTDKAPAYLGFMSSAIKVGNLMFTGGSIPRHPGTLEIPGTFDEQCKLVMENLKAVVEAGGTSLANAIKVNVYLADINNWARFNDFFKEYFTGDPPPARTAVQIARLNNDYMVEVEAVVYAP